METHWNTPFWLRQIPEVMKLNGFVHGQMLQERWFNGPAFAFSKEYRMGLEVPFSLLGPERIETKAITTEWALKFAQPRSALEVLLREWNSPSPSTSRRHYPRRYLMREEFAKNLRRHLASPEGQAQVGTSFQFGDLANTPPWVMKSKYIVQQRPIEVSMLSDPITGWFASCANASWDLAVEAEVQHHNGSYYKAKIVKMAYYIYDIYDFFGDFQPLGIFSRTEILNDPRKMKGQTIPLPIPYEKPTQESGDLYYYVRNKSYSDYRNKYSFGGDFFIFSNPVVLPVKDDEFKVYVP